jgi:hypothetical protein
LIEELRLTFNDSYRPSSYQDLVTGIDRRSGTHVEFRVAETPIFLPQAILENMAASGAALARRLLAWPEYLAAARRSIPGNFVVAGETAHPQFLTADFALVHRPGGELVPRLVELQAFPSVYAYQAALCEEYARAYNLPKSLGTYLGGLDKESYWALMRRTIVGDSDPENVALTEVDPMHQKTLPDFLLTAQKLGIAIVDIAKLVPQGDRLYYRNDGGRLVPVERIYNRAIADEMLAKHIELPFRLTDDWDVTWAGHPNWYFLMSKFSVPWLSAEGGTDSVVPPAAFLNDFLSGPGFGQLESAGVELASGDDAVYDNLLLKPLFSFAGKGIQFAPSRAELLAIPESERGDYLVQQRMHFVPTIATPHGMTQAEIRILYLWPEGGELTPAMSLVRLGRGKMMGVDHNRNQEWVGASAAFWR